ncbi:heme lyase CcmF/NrfE family subunit [Aliikangiella coralliicola]|uniref:Heme lyase CcmF/NrfE family subunit n=1 Tax=Aliikangiella coralliicola TaxID=2592383 RepID=A0A545UAC5_9GAMM|nr:heme lyase CcmF/NrfE family subunit [Aliikangiella coralliicola]TQV86427.1 heme lyase CcmF/NrfE family subunit [Aliikangiella coralliicola]
MIPEIGNLALAFGLALALVQFVMPLVGIATNRWRMVLVAKPAAIGQFIFVALSFACLAWSFYINDFSVAYVASHSNSSLPVAYRIGATWGGHEGSLLLWAFILSSWTFAVAMLSKALPALTRARVLAVLGFVSIGFICFILFTSNPFDRLIPIYPIDGSDLNPLLQDPGMVFHPPLLYMGYVGFSVAFAFALAALLEGRIDTLWARWVRPWTQAAWMFLTLGIAAGSWWAYYELGWGGWWFWDPVENASFMPWLIGTALLHSLAATEKRGVFKAWTTLLAIAAFSFSLLGTFLVRSGVLTSVHAFANDPVRGTYILIFLGVVVGASLFLFAARASKVSVTSWYNLLSRELLFLVNNLILVVATVMILIGTLQPIISEMLNLGKISVGPPYFNLVFTILMTPLIFLVGLGPIVNWRQHSFQDLVARTRYAAIASLAAGLVFVISEFERQATDLVQIFVGVFLIAWVIILNLGDWWKRASKKRSSTLMNLHKISPSFIAMYTAHIGMVIVVIGVVISSHFSVEKNIRLGIGQNEVVEGYQFTFEKLTDVVGPNYDALRGHFTVTKNDEVVARLEPEKRRYHASGQWMTEAGIDASLMRDLYVALGERLPDSNDWAVRIYVKPYVSCLWLGGILMGLGGLIAMTDKRYRARAKQTSKSSDSIALEAV